MANIDKELNQIKNAVYGREVRGSIHDGIKKINDEVEDSTTTSNQAKHQVENIQEQVDNLVVSGDSSVEAAQARVDKDNHNYSTLKERLDTEQDNFTSQLAETEQVIERLNDVKASKADVIQQITEAKNESKEYADGLFSNLDGLQIKGGFDSLQELINAYPTGTEGLFVVGNYLYGWNGNEWKIVKELEVMPWADFMTEQDEEWVI